MSDQSVNGIKQRQIYLENFPNFKLISISGSAGIYLVDLLSCNCRLYTSAPASYGLPLLKIPHKSYSFLSASAGFAFATLTDCKLTVSNAIITDNTAANTNGNIEILTLKSNEDNHLPAMI